MRIVLFLLFFSILYELTAQVSTDSLVAYYPFNGNARDITENNQDGIVNGATLTTDRFGSDSSAYFFDGNDYIDLMDDSVHFNSNDFTISMWIKTLAENSIEHLYAKFNDSYLDGITIWAGSFFSNTQINVGFKGENINSVNQVGDNKWHHIAFVADINGYGQVYLDGAKDGDSADISTKVLDLTNHARLGASLGTPDEFFIGKLDDIRIYHRALNQGEISLLYQENDSDTTSFFLNVNKNPEHAGSIELDPPGGIYKKGSRVKLMAIPANGFVFTSWSGDILQMNDSITISIDSNINISANFEAIESFNVAYKTLGNGSIIGDTFQLVINDGKTTPVTAVPGESSIFIEWLDEGEIRFSTSPTLELTNVNKDITLTAVFDDVAYHKRITQPGFEFYPNPVENTMSINSEKISEVFILNQSGQIIKTFIVKRGLSDFDLSELAPGYYYLKVTTNETLYYFKLLKLSGVK